MPTSFHLTVRSPCCAPCDCRVRMSTSGFNDAGLFASGRAAVVGQLARCTRATQIRRLCSTASAPTWPAAPSAAPRRHECGRPPHGRTSRCMLEPLMRAGPGCVLCALLVSCIVHAARAHAERCANPSRTRLSGGCSNRKVAICIALQRFDLDPLNTFL